MIFRRLEGFSDVDAAGEVETYVRCLDHIAATAWVHEIKQLTYRLLAEAERIVDVGCGTGEDVRALAPRAIGVDASERMLEEAHRRGPGEFVHASADALPFPDGSFDGYRAERLLQHLDEPAAAIAEAHRVLRPRGRAVLADQDYETLIFDGDDRALTRAVLNAYCDSFRSGWIGRQLPALLRDAGFEELEIHPCPRVVTSWREHGGELVGPVADAASRAGVGGADEWLAEQRRRGAEGRFFSSGTMFVVSARKGDQ